MFVSTNREISIPTRDSASLTVKDHAVGILIGKEDSLASYMSLRTFDRSNQPAWLDAFCFRLAESRFKEIPFSKVLGELMYTATIKHLGKPVNSWISKNVQLQSPEKVRQQWFEGVREIQKVATPRFTEQHYSQIGVPETGLLSELLELPLTSGAVQHPSDLLQHIKRLTPSLMSGESKLEDVFGSIINFDPACNGSFGVAAAKAYFDIGEAIIRYSILSDALEHFDIPLTEKKLSELYSHVAGLPCEQWKDDPKVQALFTYANALHYDPALSENISKKDIFSRFAMTGRPLSDLLSEVNRLTEQKVIQGTPHLEKGEILEGGETATLLDQMLNSIENLFLEWDIDANTEELAPLHLARLAVSRRVPFAKLERLLILHEFDGSKVIEALRPEGRSTANDRSTTAVQDRPQVLTAGIEPEITSLSIFIHREGNKEPFNSWYQELQKSQKHRVDLALKKFADGHFGNVKKLCTRARSEADVSAYEVKIKDSGLRIYFRYLPNQRVVLLGGGDKYTQERDIPLVMDRAVLYNGNNQSLSEGLRKWEESEG